jgi:hypothetical protein
MSQVCVPAMPDSVARNGEDIAWVDLLPQSNFAIAGRRSSRMVARPKRTIYRRGSHLYGFSTGLRNRSGFVTMTTDPDMDLSHGCDCEKGIRGTGGNVNPSASPVLPSNSVNRRY